jgi:hypothetical protein
MPTGIHALRVGMQRKKAAIIVLFIAARTGLSPLGKAKYTKE